MPVKLLRSKLLGHCFEYINHIEDESGAQLRLRGDHLARQSVTENDSSLHFIIRAKNEKAIEEARTLIKDLVAHVTSAV